jgi:hypothetical protein
VMGSETTSSNLVSLHKHVSQSHQTLWLPKEVKQLTQGHMRRSAACESTAMPAGLGACGLHAL